MKKLLITTISLLASTVLWAQNSVSDLNAELETQKDEIINLINNLAPIFFIAGALAVVAVFFFKREETKKALIAYIGALVFWGVVNAMF